jgi:hypothetical protein
MTSVTSESLPTYLADQFPAAAADIERVDRESPDIPAVNAYTLMSEVFWWGIFEPALTTSDEAVIRQCFDVLEELLASNDQNVREAAGIRVTEWMAGPKWRAFGSTYGGANLQRDLERVTGHTA